MLKPMVFETEDDAAIYLFDRLGGEPGPYICVQFLPAFYAKPEQLQREMFARAVEGASQEFWKHIETRRPR